MSLSPSHPQNWFTRFVGTLFGPPAPPPVVPPSINPVVATFVIRSAYGSPILDQAMLRSS